VIPAKALAWLLALAAAESGAPIGDVSADQWAWGRFADSFLGPAILLAGMTLFLLVTLRAKRRRREMDELAQRSGREPVPPGTRESVERMLVDLEEVARSISAMLDTRMRTLEKLIRDADQRIARLGSGVGDRTAPPAEGRPSGSDPGGEGTGAPAPAGEKPRPGEKAREALAHHADIYGLADEGLSVQEIAERTGYQRGEVELVLSLRKATRAAEEEPGEG
jgi:hypothetical protein